MNRVEFYVGLLGYVGFSEYLGVNALWAWSPGRGALCSGAVEDGMSVAGSRPRKYAPIVQPSVANTTTEKIARATWKAQAKTLSVLKPKPVIVASVVS